MTLYSTELAPIGEDKSGNAGVLVQSYIPQYGASGAVAGLLVEPECGHGGSLEVRRPRAALEAAA